MCVHVKGKTNFFVLNNNNHFFHYTRDFIILITMTTPDATMFVTDAAAASKRALPVDNGKTEPTTATDSHGTVAPVKKRAKTTRYNAVLAAIGDAPTTADLSTRAKGTACYGLVMNQPKDKKNTVRKTGAAFHVTQLRVKLGVPDFAKDVLYDEKNDTIEFVMPDADALEAAKREREKTDKFVPVEKTDTYKVDRSGVHWLKVPDTSSLPGVEFPSVVRITGIHATASRAKLKNKETGEFLVDETGAPIYGRVFKDMNATAVTPLECVGRSPSRMVRYICESGAMSNWYHEMPPYDAQVDGWNKGGDRPLIIPIVRLDDEEAWDRFFPVSEDRGFRALIRHEEMTHKPERYFYLPTPTRKAYEDRAKNDKSVRIPSAGDVTMDNCDEFGICVNWSIVVTQWNKKIHPAMSEENPQVYDINLSAYGSGLWSAGLSHPQHWFVFRHHIPFIGGVLMCQENRVRTKDYKMNAPRRQEMQLAPRGSPVALGIGPHMKQAPAVWSRGVLLDVESYLKKYALRCSYATATVLLGKSPGEAEKQGVQLDYNGGKCGEEFIKDKDGEFTKHTTPLRFTPEGFFCFNAAQDVVYLDEENLTIDQYYVLTGFVPRLDRRPGSLDGKQTTAMLNARKMVELVPKIQDEEVLAICKDAVLDVKHQHDAVERWSQPGVTESQRAAAEWLKCAQLAAMSYDMRRRPPYLVFATRKPSSALATERSEEAFANAVRGWSLGPTRALMNAPIRINKPNEDELDAALDQADDDDDDDGADVDGDKAMSDASDDDDEGEEEEARDDIQATLDCDDDSDQDQDSDMAIEPAD